MSLLLVVAGVGLLVWMVALTVAGVDRCDRWERRHKRRYQGYHRAPAGRASRRRVSVMAGTGGTAAGSGTPSRSVPGDPLTDS